MDFKMSVEQVHSSPCNLINLPKSLLRVRGSDGLMPQILLLEKEWQALLDDVEVFLQEARDMVQKNQLLLGIRFNRNFKTGQLMESYKERKFCIPYLCFWKKRNIFKWEEVSKLLAQKNASFDEIMLHMWLYRGMRDFYYRAYTISGHIEQLLHYQEDCNRAMAIENFNVKMLPDAMRRVPDEQSLPGY